VVVLLRALLLVAGGSRVAGVPVPESRDLFNGKFVNGISRSSQKKGYICLESEGAEIHFRNIKIMELPPGVTFRRPGRSSARLAALLKARNEIP
jgi:hypothetical protein